MRVRLGVLALTIVSAGIASDLTPAQRQANIESFEYVWKTVRDRHWEARPGGLDWQAVHDELRPKVEKAATIEDARAVLSDMLGRLHQTHFGIFPAEVYEDFESPGATDGQPGLDVRVLDGHAIVTAVEADSSAATHGVKPGWEIVSVDGRGLAPAIQRIQENVKESNLLDIRLNRMVLSRLNGPVGKAAHVQFLDGANRKVSLDLERVLPRGAVVKLGSFPPFYFWAESKKVRPAIGYVRFNAFFDPDTLSKTFAGAIKDCGDCSGFVIDLRGNPGGLGGLAMGVGGWFVDKSGLKLGTMLMKGVKLDFVLFPRPPGGAGGWLQRVHLGNLCRRNERHPSGAHFRHPHGGCGAAVHD